MIQREISDKTLQMDSLDGLRGFAALIVVFSHTSHHGMFFVPFLDLRGIGKSGVILFFLLSSFLLTLPLLRNGKEVLTVPVMSHYWQRRFFRIYPLYTLYLLLGVVSTWAFAAVLGKHGIGIPFDLDWHGFFNHMFLLEGKGVTWSIAVEFKYYLILPILVLLIAFVQPYGLTITSMFFFGLLLLTQIISPQSESLTNDARLLPYMPIFIMGMFLAVLQSHMNSSGPNRAVHVWIRCLGYLGVVGVIVMTPLIFSLFGEEVPDEQFHRQFILNAMFWSFILLAAVNVPGALQKMFTLPVLRFYGAISFSVYLFHPIFAGGMSRLPVNGYLGAWLVLLASTATAYISFTLLEAPISKYKLRWSSLAPMLHFARRLTKTK